MDELKRILGDFVESLEFNMGLAYASEKCKSKRLFSIEIKVVGKTIVEVAQHRTEQDMVNAMHKNEMSLVPFRIFVTPQGAFVQASKNLNMN